jgi:hypothetical protein
MKTTGSKCERDSIAGLAAGMSERVPVSTRTVRRVTVTLVALVLLVSSPVLGLVDLTPSSRTPDTVGDGTATLTVSSVPTDRVRMTPGRFGTGVVYLRIPPATVDVASVTGQPRLVYVARVPELGFERVATTQLDADTRESTVRMDARAFANDRIDRETYRVELVLRVQSFETNDVIYRRNATVTAPTRESG